MRVLLIGLFLMLNGVVSTFSQTDLAEQYFQKGTEFAKSQNYEKGIKAYKRSLDLVKNNKKLKSKIHYNIGSCFYQLGKFADAKKSFVKAIKLSKHKYIQAIYSLGLTQIELKKLRSAEANFRKVLRMDRKHAEAWFDLGMVLLERKMYGNAKIAFQKSIEHKTTRFAEARNNLGVISAMQGDIDFAEVQFLQAYAQSKGTLLLAKKNVEFCRKYRRAELANRLAINN